MQISLNIIDILCLHIFFWIRSNSRITFIVFWEFERIQKKICRHKMSIMFNEICINEEMLPKYTYIYIYIYHHHHVVPLAGISLSFMVPVV